MRALDGVSLTISQGEYVALMGPSGSGKSTLLALLGCLDRPTTGCYRLDRQEMTCLPDRQLAILRNRVFGFVFQGFHLIPYLTVQQNVALPLFYASTDEIKNRVQEAMQRAQIQHRAHHRPRQLSGGEAQRVAIARALVGGPKILIADEPTGSLDTDTGRKIVKLFTELNDQGITIIMATHNQEIADHCQRILRMRDGALCDL